MLVARDAWSKLFKMERRSLLLLNLLLFVGFSLHGAELVRAFVSPGEVKQPGYFAAEITLPQIAAAPRPDIVLLLRDCSYSMKLSPAEIKLPDAPQHFLIDFDLFAAAPVELKPGQPFPPAHYDGATDMSAAFKAAAAFLKERTFGHATLILLSDGRDSCGEPDARRWLDPLAVFGPDKIAIELVFTNARLARSLGDYHKQPGHATNITVTAGEGTTDVGCTFHGSVASGGTIQIVGRFFAPAGKVSLLYTLPDGTKGKHVAQLKFTSDPKNAELILLWANGRLRDLELERSLELDPAQRAAISKRIQELTLKFALHPAQATSRSTRSAGAPETFPDAAAATEVEKLIRANSDAAAEKLCLELISSKRNEPDDAKAAAVRKNAFDWLFALQLWKGDFDKAVQTFKAQRAENPQRNIPDLTRDLLDCAFGGIPQTEIAHRKEWQTSAAGCDAALNAAAKILEHDSNDPAHALLAGGLCARAVGNAATSEQHVRIFKLLEKVFAQLQRAEDPALADWVCNVYTNNRWAGDPTDADTTAPLQENLDAAIAGSLALGGWFHHRGFPLIHKYHGWDALTPEKQRALLRKVSRVLEILPLQGPMPPEGLAFTSAFTLEDWNELDHIPTPAEWLGWQGKIRECLLDPVNVTQP